MRCLRSSLVISPCAGFALKIFDVWNCWAGVLLQRIQARPCENAMAERAFARYSASRPPEESEPDQETRSDDQLLPPLLTRNLPISNEISWQRVSSGLWQYRVALPKGIGQMRLLRLTPGEVVPEWVSGAASIELALVLQGRLSEARGKYVRGDLVERTGQSGQELKAVGDIDCVCLIAGDASAVAQARQVLIELRSKTVPAALRVGNVLRQSAPLAASLALLVGLGLGWLARGGPETGVVADLVRADGSRLIAQGALQEVLETLPSGRETVVSLDGRALALEVKMTFEDQSGSYCRQYRINGAPSASYSGIACKTLQATGCEDPKAHLPPASSAVERTIPADSRSKCSDGCSHRRLDLRQSAGRRRGGRPDEEGLAEITVRIPYRAIELASGARSEVVDCHPDIYLVLAATHAHRSDLVAPLQA